MRFLARFPSHGARTNCCSPTSPHRGIVLRCDRACTRGCAVVLHHCMAASLSHSVRRRPLCAGRRRGAVGRRRRAERRTRATRPCTPLIIITGLVFSISEPGSPGMIPERDQPTGMLVVARHQSVRPQLRLLGHSAPLAWDDQILYQHTVTPSRGTGPRTWQNARRTARLEPGRRQQQTGCSTRMRDSPGRTHGRSWNRDGGSSKQVAAPAESADA